MSIKYTDEFVTAGIAFKECNDQLVEFLEAYVLDMNAMVTMTENDDVPEVVVLAAPLAFSTEHAVVDWECVRHKKVSDYDIGKRNEFLSSETFEALLVRCTEAMKEVCVLRLVDEHSVPREKAVVYMDKFLERFGLIRIDAGCSQKDGGNRSVSKGYANVVGIFPWMESEYSEEFGLDTIRRIRKIEFTTEMYNDIVQRLKDCLYRI